MSPEVIQEYAKGIIMQRIDGVPWMDIVEYVEEKHDGEPTDADHQAIEEAILSAKIILKWGR